jgi:4-hydroxy-4-methyl-2-oxoglutarate aldolase
MHLGKGQTMKIRLFIALAAALALAACNGTGGNTTASSQAPAAAAPASPAADAPADNTPLTDAQIIEGFKLTEVASVSDAIEQLYGEKAYMPHDMRAVFKTKFVGPAVTVQMKKEENKEGSKATQGMIDAIDSAPAGSVYVMSIENGLDYAGMGALMATGMKVRGLAGAVIDGSVRDLPQIQRIQFPVYSRGVAPSTMVGHFRSIGVNVPVTCAGVKVNPGDLIVADEDGVVVVAKAKAAEVLKKSQALDLTEHQTLTFIEKFRSIKEAIAKFGRI